jgi:hypothetical protein
MRGGGIPESSDNTKHITQNSFQFFSEQLKQFSTFVYFILFYQTKQHFFTIEITTLFLKEKTPEEKTPEEKTPEEKTPEEKTPEIQPFFYDLLYKITQK